MNTTIPLGYSIVLVAVVPSPRDLEIARVLGWYRIPLRFAPKMIDVDYIALYQPSIFGGEHGCRIEFFAEVKGYELTTRKELFRDEIDHPRANEEYYKLQLGSLKKLEFPLPAGKWKRLTFLFTLGEAFSQALSIDDLVLSSERRQILWRTLKERSMESTYQSANEKDFELDPEILFFLSNFSNLRESVEPYHD